MSIAESASLEIREESIDETLDDMVRLLVETRRRPARPERFEWLYRQNPDGAARVWGLRDGRSGELVGFTACLPRRIVVNGQVRIGWNGADFSIVPRYRTLGPAVKLRREAKLAIEAGRADFLYAHPNERMSLIHRMAGHAPVGCMLRMARPLRLGTWAGNRLGGPRLGRLVGTVLDPLHRLACREIRTRPSRDIEFVPSIRFDSRFDELFDGHRQTRPVVGVRDAAYLNWRYSQNPLCDVHGLLAVRGDRLAGYLVFIDDHGMGQIKDVFPPDDPALVAKLLAAALATAWSMGLETLSIVLLDQSPLMGALQQCGFKVRERGSQMYVYTPPSAPWREVLLSPESWFINEGDRDV